MLRCPSVLPSDAPACTSVTCTVWMQSGQGRGVRPPVQGQGEQSVGWCPGPDATLQRITWSRMLVAGRVGNEKRAAAHSWFRPSKIATASRGKHIHRGVSACENKRDFTVLKHAFFPNMLERCSQYVTFQGTHSFFKMLSCRNLWLQRI